MCCCRHFYVNFEPFFVSETKVSGTFLVLALIFKDLFHENDTDVKKMYTSISNQMLAEPWISSYPKTNRSIQNKTQLKASSHKFITLIIDNSQSLQVRLTKTNKIQFSFHLFVWQSSTQICYNEDIINCKGLGKLGPH